MTTNEAHAITVKQYAVLLGVSLSTAYRKMHARRVWGLAEKRDGRFVVLLSTAEVRSWKAALVDREKRATMHIALAWKVKDGQSFDFPVLSLDDARALKCNARDALMALGAGDLIIALDAARVSKTPVALARIDRLIAA